VTASSVALSVLHAPVSPDPPHHTGRSYPHLIGEAKGRQGCHSSPDKSGDLLEPAFFRSLLLLVGPGMQGTELILSTNVVSIT
jgi:hypothetical protein